MYTMGKIMNKYIIYARKSSEADDRQALSIESQLNELKNVIEKRKLTILSVLTEQKSAKSPTSPTHRRMSFATSCRPYCSQYCLAHRQKPYSKRYAQFRSLRIACNWSEN